jgi:plasmid stabilization system protein ParE
MSLESRPPTIEAFDFVAAAGARRPALPLDLLQAVRTRLQFAALAIILATGLSTLVSQLTGFVHNAPVLYGSLAVGWTLSLIVIGLARWSRIRPAVLLDIGLVYEVLIALLFSLSGAQLRWLTDDPASFMGWSPIAVWALIYPIIVPNSTRKTAIASFATVLMEPLAILILAWSDLSVLPATAAFIRKLWPSLVAAVLAIGVSRIVYRLGEQVAQARQLGSYHLETLLGKGGMGEVWKATHRMLARPAAVKLIRQDALGEKDPAGVERALRRFEREARATAALRSPHTIELYDFGISQGGTFYYVMELLDGVDLQTLVERFGPQPSARVARILRHACHSLHEAHLAGLVHRDIKPANIFLCRYGADLDWGKVLDFGIVKHRSFGTAEEAKLTEVGAFTGTPAYMPPEMVLGDGSVDGRADLYSLGCVGYWLLTGRFVFDGMNPMAVMAAHAHQEPTPMAQRLSGPVHAGLDSVIMACLAKDPARRPPTALDLSRRLDALGIEREWDEEQASAWWSEHFPTSGDAEPTNAE